MDIILENKITEGKKTTRREIVIKALQHKKTGIVPFHMDFTQQALENLIAFTGDLEIENKTGAFLYYKQYWGCRQK